MFSEKEENSTMMNRPSYRRYRLFAIAFAAVGSCYLLWTSVSSPLLFRHNCHEQSTGSVRVLDPVAAIRPDAIEKKLVPLEAHIMSKCPDARVCPKLHRIWIEC